MNKVFPFRPQTTELRSHLPVAAGDVDDDVLVSGGDGRAVDRNAVDPLLVAGNSHSGGLWKPEEIQHTLKFG